MSNKDLKNKTIICSVCSGSGLNKRGFACKNCLGLGVCITKYNRFFSWNLKLSKSIIELNHVRIKIYQITKFLSYIIGCCGFIFLALWLFQNYSTNILIEDFYFWNERESFLLIFWLSIIIDMFLIYQISRENKQKRKINFINYKEKFSNIMSPNNWGELKKFNCNFKIDVVSGFEKKTFKAVEEAYMLAYKLGNNKVEPLHLFFVCLQEKEVAAIFSRLNVNAHSLISMIKKQLTKLGQGNDKLILSNEIKETLISSYIEAFDMGQRQVTIKNLLTSSVQNSKVLNEIIYDLDVTVDKIFNVVSWFVANEETIKKYKEYRNIARFKPSSNMDRAYTSVATKVLKNFAYDLTLAARSGKLEFCINREEEITSIFQSIESGYGGIILVGQPGAGKKSIIHGIAQLMVKEDAPSVLQDKRLMEVDLARLIGGTTPEQAETRMLEIIHEVARAGNIILYFKGIDKIVGITSGAEGSLDLASILASAIEKKSIYCFASVSTKSYLDYIEESSLGLVMQKINVREPEGNQLIQIIESKVSYFEAKYKVYFSYSSLEQCIKFSKKYIYDKFFPKKAIDILEMVAVKTSKTKGEQSLVTKKDIASVISNITGIPLTQVTDSESQNLLNLEKKIHNRMIGQEEAVKMISASLRRARTQLREGNRPIANFLFLGPTGVGKTELAKSVSEVYFGKEDYMIRIDMSEYQHPDSVKKMIGDVHGTRGYLTEKVKKSPFSLILLDEIEKAHPDILNLFLQVMDDGRLTDGGGRTIDFSSSIIVATSNAGAIYIQEEVKKNTSIEQIKDGLINEHLNKVMRPEFINRFDGVIVFKPLTISNVIEIARLMLGKLEKLLDLKGIKMKISEEGLKKIAQEGFDPKFGARPLRRAIQDLIENKIANKILIGELNRRDTISIDDKMEIQIEKGKEL